MLTMPVHFNHHSLSQVDNVNVHSELLKKFSKYGEAVYYETPEVGRLLVSEQMCLYVL